MAILNQDCVIKLFATYICNLLLAISFAKLSLLLDYVNMIFILFCNILHNFPNWPEEQIHLFHHI